MQGSSAVLEQLQQVLAYELAAIDQYYVHACMYEHWGYRGLHAQIRRETEDEKAHVAVLIRRILFLEGVPDLSRRVALSVGATVSDMLTNDLQLEYDVVAVLKDAIAVCESERDYRTRVLLERMLSESEELHAHWLEQQIGLIDKLGLRNYLHAQTEKPVRP
jgi:bacterioferritin